MRLRDFLLLGLAAVAILNSQGALARDGDKVYRLGILSPAAGPVQRIGATALPELARLGFTEGHNLVVEARVGTTELFPAVARDLVSAHPEVIIAVGAAAIRAIREVGVRRRSSARSLARTRSRPASRPASPIQAARSPGSSC
jgi:putative tryptophan/tyrosine transport system substrate-binding protein